MKKDYEKIAKANGLPNAKAAKERIELLRNQYIYLKKIVYFPAVKNGNSE